MNKKVHIGNIFSYLTVVFAPLLIGLYSIIPGMIQQVPQMGYSTRSLVYGLALLMSFGAVIPKSEPKA